MTTDFAMWIRDELNRRGWSQASLAERAGLSRSCISKMLTSGRRKPGMRFFAGIATAFEMPLADVILIAEKAMLRENQDTEEPEEYKSSIQRKLKNIR